MKRKINIFFCVIYVVILIGILFFGRRGQIWSNVSLVDYITSTSNIVPFSTIIGYFISIKEHEMNVDIPIKNLIGNLILFMPCAYFAYYFTNISKKRFLGILLGVIFMLEFLQAVFRVGFFDIDDVILNAFGASIVFWILKRTHNVSDKKK